MDPVERARILDPLHPLTTSAVRPERDAGAKNELEERGRHHGDALLDDDVVEGLRDDVHEVAPVPLVRAVGHTKHSKRST